MIVLHALLEPRAIELAIAQQYHLCPRWYLPLDLLDQGERLLAALGEPGLEFGAAEFGAAAGGATTAPLEPLFPKR